MRRTLAAGVAVGVTAVCTLAIVLFGVPVSGQPNEEEGSTTMSTSENNPTGPPEFGEEAEIDYLEEPTIDGPEPLTREEFLQDSKPDSNTGRRPRQPIGEEGSASLGDSSVIERTN